MAEVDAIGKKQKELIKLQQDLQALGDVAGLMVPPSAGLTEVVNV